MNATPKTSDFFADDIQYSISHNISRPLSPSYEMIHNIERLKRSFFAVKNYYGVTDLNDIVYKVDTFDKQKLKFLLIELFNMINNACSDQKYIEQQYIDRKNSIIPADHDIDKLIKNIDIQKNNDSSIEDIVGFVALNNYILCDKIGNGSYGKVYLCIDSIDNIYYAAKEIMIFDENIYDVKKEITIMKNFDHPNILKIKDVIEDEKNKKIFIIMPYIKNGPIVKINQDCTTDIIPRDKFKIYARQIIDGLRYLHTNNIIHCDIKPDNILLGDNDNVYLIDFGSCQINKHKKYLNNKINGTLLFFAPELFLSGPQMNTKMTDIWALGVTLFIMLYGYFPFFEKNYSELRNKIVNTKPNYPENIDEDEHDFFEKMLYKDPCKRSSLRDLKYHRFITSV
jgi:hypothetical protein